VPSHVAHWRYMANTTELLLPLAHPNGSAVLAQHTAESPYILQWAPISPKIAPSHGSLDHHLIHDSLVQSEPTIQTASRSVQPFSHRRLQSIPILYNVPPLPPHNCPFPCGGAGPQSNTWFPRPTRVLNPNGISTGSAVFAGLTSDLCDRPSDRARYSVGNGRCDLKTAEPIETPFGMLSRVDPSNHVLDGGPDPPYEGAILRGRTCSDTANDTLM